MSWEHEQAVVVVLFCFLTKGKCALYLYAVCNNLIARERIEIGEIFPHIIPSKRAFHCSLVFFFTTYPHNPNITLT